MNNDRPPAWNIGKVVTIICKSTVCGLMYIYNITGQLATFCLCLCMLSSRIVNSVIGKGLFTVGTRARYTLLYIVMCQVIAIYSSMCTWHCVSQETSHVWIALLCWTTWKAAYNVFAGSMYTLLYISLYYSDFHGPQMLQRGPEFSPNYIIITSSLHHNCLITARK